MIHQDYDCNFFKHFSLVPARALEGDLISNHNNRSQACNFKGKKLCGQVCGEQDDEHGQENAPVEEENRL